MAAIQPALAELGAEVLVVSFTPPAKAAAYLAKYPLPFQVACDPERKAYLAFGLQRARWRDILGGKVLLGYLRRMFQGWMPRKPQKQEDVLQLGGDFVLDGQRRILYAHPSRTPMDRPTGKELLDVIRNLGARTGSWRNILQ